MLCKAWQVNDIRNKYIHIDIYNIKKIFRYNYDQIRDWIQMEKTESNAEKDCLEAYKNLMEILENLYSEKRYTVEK